MPEAARQTDDHTCPLVEPGPKPHVGGPVLPPCCPTVLIESCASARIGDRASCKAPLDTLAQGSSSVLVGGLPASRKTDGTSHGGIIIGGASDVFIGGNVVTLKIAGDEQFAKDLQQALSTILATRSGIEWLRQMGINGRTVMFEPLSDPNGYCRAHNSADSKNGIGTDSTIAWNPSHHTTDPLLPGKQGSPGSNVILAHEMVHALHNANGDNRNGPSDQFPGQSGSSQRNEERSTVGTAGSIVQPDGTSKSTVRQPNGTFEIKNSF
jgi:uncharacterized Zn-binding protein involved in type VI secretion